MCQRRILPRLAKRLQNLGNIFRGDANSGVGDRQVQSAIVTTNGIDGYSPVLRREAHRVGEQIDKDLANLPRVRTQFVFARLDIADSVCDF